MLFDLKGKRKRVVQVTYLGLAILFGGSLVLFGTGSSVSGGLIDAITGNNGGGANSAFQDQVDRTRKAVRINPKSEQAWLDLTRAEFNFAASPDGSDADTGQLTDAGKQAVLETINSWERYLKLKPKEPDAATAQFAAIAYGATQDYRKAVKTQALAAKARPSSNSYYQLAQFAYAGGLVSEGDAAAAQAIRRTPKDLRNSVRAQVKDIKKQGAQLVKQREQQKKASKQATKGQPSGTAFGPLPGQGATGGSGAAP
jgi:tetratricopeptide (TPR) repeat protein